MVLENDVALGGSHSKNNDNDNDKTTGKPQTPMLEISWGLKEPSCRTTSCATHRKTRTTPPSYAAPAATSTAPLLEWSVARAHDVLLRSWAGGYILGVSGRLGCM